MINKKQLTDKVLQNTKDFVGLSALPKVSDEFVEDLDLDSLDTIEYIMHVEEIFNIEIDDKETEKLITVQDLIDCIYNKL